MNIDQIQANKPEGATHYSYKTETYYMEKDEVLYHWHFVEWRKSFYKTVSGMRYIEPLN